MNHQVSRFKHGPICHCESIVLRKTSYFYHCDCLDMNSTPFLKKVKLGVLSQHEINSVFHYSPLHYLTFVARHRQLLSKPALINIGFKEHHFRSTSYKQDMKRGFAEFVHMTLDPHPPILRAKLAAGFPHFELQVPSTAVECGEFALCRFNIAKTRYFRGAKQEPPETPANGRYYDGKLIPIARTSAERLDLFSANFNVNMIEVLVPDRLSLPDETIVTLYHPEDLNIAEQIQHALGTPWQLRLMDVGGIYERNTRYARQVREFVARTLDADDWTGNGLEFDRV